MVMGKAVRGSGLEEFWRQTGGDRRRFVDEAFAGVAGDYDRLVRLFSGGLDRRWRQACLDACNIGRGGCILDCATGTGALALAAAQQAGVTARVVGVDACGPMLREARRKASEVSPRPLWVQARAECLPIRAETVSAVTVSFALRHMDVKMALAEMTRVLVPGGHVALLEFLRPPAGVAPRLALAYLRWLVPPLAGLIAWSRMTWTLTAYLPRTIQAAPSAPELIGALESSGFHVLMVQPLFAHLVWLVLAMKPLRQLTCDMER